MFRRYLYSKNCHLRPPLLPQKSGLTWQVVSEQRDTSSSSLSNKPKLFSTVSFNDIYCPNFFPFWDILPCMLTTLKCLILILKILHLVFCYSIQDSVPEPKFSICTSKWSLLTGKIWTCGHKKCGLWPYITGWSLSSGEIYKKNCWCIQIVVLNERWSLSSGGLWDRFYCIVVLTLTLWLCGDKSYKKSLFCTSLKDRVIHCQGSWNLSMTQKLINIVNDIDYKWNQWTNPTMSRKNWTT